MSSIKNILTVVTEPRAARGTLVAAVQVARHLGAHVDALHVRPDPVTSLPLVGEAMSGAMVDEMMNIAARESDIRAGAVRAIFDDVTAGSDCAWIEDVGSEEQVVALRACRADLILLARPTRENETTALMTLNAALMQSGRPVLAVPPDIAPPTSFKHIAFFWNGSTEATRAITAALPFMRSSEHVTVLRVEEEEWFAPTEDLESFLAYHGVSAAISKVLPRQGRTGEALLAAAAQHGADMMVMGAYTRSKLRQLILGSVTGHVMQHASMPVLLCH